MSDAVETPQRYIMYHGWVVSIRENATFVSFSLPGDEYSNTFYFGLLAAEVAIAAIIACILRRIWYSAGPGDRGRARQVWARVSEIRLQPAPLPILLAAATSTGASRCFVAVQEAVINIVGLDSSQHIARALTGLVGAAASAFLTTVMYRWSGGRHWIVSAVVAAEASLFMDVGLDAVDDLDVTITVITAASTLAFQMPFTVWAAYKRLPAPARPISDTSPATANMSGLDTVLPLIVGPLALVKLLEGYLEDYVVAVIYIYRLERALVRILLFLSCAVASVFSVKHAVLRHQYRWQWRAFLTPAVGLSVLYLGLCLSSACASTPFFRFNATELLVEFCVHGTSGLLGSAAFLKLAERRLRAEDAKQVQT